MKLVVLGLEKEEHARLRKSRAGAFKTPEGYAGREVSPAEIDSSSLFNDFPAESTVVRCTSCGRPRYGAIPGAKPGRCGRCTHGKSSVRSRKRKVNVCVNCGNKCRGKRCAPCARVAKHAFGSAEYPSLAAPHGPRKPGRIRVYGTDHKFSEVTRANGRTYKSHVKVVCPKCRGDSE